MKDPIWLEGGLLCRDCDVFVGWAAAGVVRMPEQPSAWLVAHCWLCARDYAAEIERKAREALSA